MKRIAIFDFDETLVEENSLSLLFKYFLGNKPLFIYLLPIIIDFRTYIGSIKMVIKYRLYNRALSKKNQVEVFQAGRHAADKLTPIQPVVNRMMSLHEQGVEVWIITASPQKFIEGVVAKLDWPIKRVIGTLLKEENNVLTGLIEKECQMDEKVHRFNKLMQDKKVQCKVVEAYGNLPVDIPMLGLAENKFCVIDGKLSPFLNTDN